MHFIGVYFILREKNTLITDIAYLELNASIGIVKIIICQVEIFIKISDSSHN